MNAERVDDPPLLRELSRVLKLAAESGGLAIFGLELPPRLLLRGDPAQPLLRLALPDGPGLEYGRPCSREGPRLRYRRAERPDFRQVGVAPAQLLVVHLEEVFEALEERHQLAVVLKQLADEFLVRFLPAGIEEFAHGDNVREKR
jgi:hypothetical protein